MKSGYGLFILESGQRYEGYWKEDQQNGEGEEELADSVYAGNYVDGQKNGLGTMTYADGSVYTGDWEENRYHGLG